MKGISVGIVDYGVGNHCSVLKALRSLGYRCRVSHDAEILESTDILLLPGVGAFPAAMAAMNDRGLTEFVKHQARKRPILGICLGMQLLADASQEIAYTRGLGLIPGEIVPMSSPHWHIGWNTIELALPDPLFYATHGLCFYFNHSFTYDGPVEYQVCRASESGGHFPAVIRRDNVVGLQFHPEKSQTAGRQLLRKIVEGLCRA